MSREHLRAGFAQEDISPGPHLSLVGYEAREATFPPGNDGVLDPLVVRALALEDPRSSELILILCFDLCLLLNEVADWLRQSLAGATGLPVSHLILACTHTHSGPLPRKPGEVSGGGPDPAERLSPLRTGGSEEEEKDYTRHLLSQAIVAARRALGLRVPVTLSYAESLTGLGYNRRVPQPDGSVALCWNQEEFPHLVPEPSPDPWLTLLTLTPVGGGEPFAIWGTGIHPVTLGKTSRKVSADWPGQTNALLRKTLRSERILFLPGASGEVHPWHATGDSPARVTAMARAMAAHVALLAQTARPIPGTPGNTPLLVHRSKSWTHCGTTLPLHVLRLGPVFLPIFPLELFATLSAELRRTWKGPFMPVTMANGWHGYWPDRQAFTAGGYEVEVARAFGREPGDGEALLQAVREMVDLSSP